MSKPNKVSRPLSYGGPHFTSETLVNLERTAGDSSLPAWLRLVYLARARANYWQHAPFECGELAQALGIHPKKVFPAIRTAARKGHLAPASTVRCLVLDRSRYLCAFAPVKQCVEPKHADFRNLEWHGGYGKWGWWDWQPFGAAKQEAEQQEAPTDAIRRAAALVAERAG